MDSIGGMTASGRRIPGPETDLVEVTSAKGPKHLALVYQPKYAGHPALHDDIDGIEPYLRDTGVPDVLPLVEWDKEKAAFVYATGPAWPVAEIVRTFADKGRVCGVKAAMELCYLVSQLLTDVLERSIEHDIYSHGNLNPWTIALRKDGRPVILGFGLPSVEALIHVEDDTFDPHEDTLRYTPPERLRGEPEDFSSDLFSLALVAFEMMTGKPVYDGLIQDLRNQAKRGDAERRVYQQRALLSTPVREFLERSLKHDPDARFPDAVDFQYAAHDVLAMPDIEGHSLAGVVKEFRQLTRSDQVLVGGNTAALTPEQLRELAEELDDEPEVKDLPPPTHPRPVEEEGDDDTPRWSARGGRKKPRTPPAAAADAGRGRARERVGGRDRPARGSGRARGEGRDGGRTASGDELRSSLRRSSGAEPPGRASRPPERAGRGNSERETEAMGDRDSKGADDLVRRLRESRGRRGGGDERPRRASRDDEPRRSLRDDDAPRRASRDDDGPRRASRDDDGPRRSGRGDDDRPRRLGRDDERPRRAARDEPASEPGAGLLQRLRESASTKRDDATPSPEAVQGVEVVFLLGDEELVVQVDESAHLANAVALAMQQHCIVPTDLMGNVRGWYRAVLGGEPLPGEAPILDVPLEEPIELEFVKNDIVVVTWVIEGVGDPIHFQAPVGVAVPAQSLLAHLREFLGLPADAWKLFVGKDSLHPLQVLAEYEVGAGAELVVMR